MRAIGDKLRLMTRPFVRVWRRVARIAPDMPDAPEGLVGRAKYGVGFYRTLAAPRWRVAVRWVIVAFGFACYFGVQLLLAYQISRLDVDPFTQLYVNPDAYAFIAAFFIIAVSITVAAVKPTFAFIAWLVLSPVGFLFLRMDFGAGMPAITFDRVVLMAITGLLLARTLVERRRVKKPILGEWLILAFISYTALMVFVLHPDDLKLTFKVISERFDHIALAVFAYYIAKSVLVTKRHVWWAVVALVITGTYVAISAFYEHYTGVMWFSSFLGGEYRLRTEDVGLGRACGPLINPAATGTFLGITAFLTLHLSFATANRFAKFVCLCATGLQLIGCYFTFTRTGYLAPILLLIAMPFAARRFRKQYALFAVAAVIVAVVALPISLSDMTVRRRMTQPKTILMRLVVTRITESIILHHPVFGVGLGEIDHALEQYVTNAGGLSGIYARGSEPSALYPRHQLLPVMTSHNSILTIFAEQGLVGGFLFTGALLALLWHMLKLRARLPTTGVLGRDLVTLIAIAVVGHILSTLGYDIRLFKYPSYFLWVLFALAVRLGEIQAEDEKAEAVEAVAPPESVGGLVHA